jgi:archaemetzincin
MIGIVRFEDVNIELINKISIKLKEIFKDCTLSSNKLEIPKKAFNARRRQYKSDLLLSLLKEYAKDSPYEKVVGLTFQDIYTENLNFIFGHAYLGGPACIVSLRRLDPTFYDEDDNEDILIERAIKEIIHELGHCFGLNHCKNEKCVMTFSNIIFKIDSKTQDFCEKCKKLLEDSAL